MGSRQLRGAVFLFLLLPQLSLAETAGEQAHRELFAASDFPRAKQCGTCHPQQFKEWAASPHAYAQLSPVFNAMHATLVKESNGTLGDFCIRCHTPAGMDASEKLIDSNLNRSALSREGVTCVACHRREQPVGKASGRFGLSHGDIFSAIYGPHEGDELKRVLASAEYEVNTERGKEGRAIHSEAFKNDQMSKSAFCGSCHDVNSPVNFRLEEAFSEYKSSPASGDGISCQDCHMGKEPGVPSAFAEMSAALVGGRPTRPTKHADHSFVGPDYSIVHPALFPHNPEADDVADIAQWLQFDYKAGWGTDDFEDEVENDEQFPEHWKSMDDRYRARDIIEHNLETLGQVAEKRKLLLQRGYVLGDIRLQHARSDGLEFDVEVKNGTTGHNVPTGFDAERIVFLRVSVKDKNGSVVFQSGDLDPNGDLRDGHSLYVHNGELPLDDYLFSLQSRFVVDMIRGSDREQVLTTNYSASPLPFMRPPTNANMLVGRPVGARKHRQTIPPEASRWASYRVSEEQLAGSSPPYTASVELVAGMVPVNLVHAIQGVGFDYGMSPRQVADAVVAGHQILWQKELVINPTAGTEGN